MLKRKIVFFLIILMNTITFAQRELKIELVEGFDNFVLIEISGNEQKEKTDSELLQKQYYEVKPGDTLFKISLETNLTIERIKKLNGLKSDLIFPGDKLKVSPEVLEELNEN